VDCGQTSRFCLQFTEAYPRTYLFKGKEQIRYQLVHEEETLMNFVNKNCGTERGIDGMLIDTAGIIKEASVIAQEFMTGLNKQDFVEKLKEIKGADVYLRVAERFLNKGEDQVKKDIVMMDNILRERKVSWQTLDGIKRRLNVFRDFFKGGSFVEDAKANL
jgi:hypothetical protein